MASSLAYIWWLTRHSSLPSPFSCHPPRIIHHLSSSLLIIDHSSSPLAHFIPPIIGSMYLHESPLIIHDQHSPLKHHYRWLSPPSFICLMAESSFGFFFRMRIIIVAFRSSPLLFRFLFDLVAWSVPLIVAFFWIMAMANSLHHTWWLTHCLLLLLV